MTTETQPGNEQIYRAGLTWEKSQTRTWRGVAFILFIGNLCGWGTAVIVGYGASQIFPLVKTEVVPLIVDKNTGDTQVVTTLSQERGHLTTTQMEAVRRSFAGQYVIRRETYDPKYVADNFDMVALWSDPNGPAWRDYQELMTPSNPRGPIHLIGASGEIRPELISVSRLNDTTMQVRFELKQRMQGAITSSRWSTTLRYNFIRTTDSNRSRLNNPLGFQVTEYNKVPESMPVEGQSP